MRVLSLFAGIGGLDLGLERAGLVCRWQVENNPYAVKVLEKHWPNVKRYGDIITLDPRELEWVDLICGGFPCQDISHAGKRAGLGGSRSGLWFEMLRIVRHLRPRYVLVENVAALLGRGLGAVLGDLASCGYDAEWDCLPAAAFGAPHIRDRVFIVADSEGCGQPLRRPEGERSGRPPSGSEDVADAAGTRCAEGLPRAGGALRNGTRRQEPQRRGIAADPGRQGLPQPQLTAIFGAGRGARRASSCPMRLVGS